MPMDFPVAAYQAIHLKIAPHANANNLIYAQFAGGWNAITYRYCGMDECDGLFAESISKFGTAPPAEERYRQERDLFGFFSNGFSVFEAFFYSLFAAGAFLKPSAFPITTPQDQRRISASHTLAAYDAAFKGDPVVAALKLLTNAPAYVELRDIRNVLSHRSAPGRTIHVAMGDEPAPDQWKLQNIVLNDKTTSTRRNDISCILVDAMESCRQFSDRNF